MSDFTLEDIIKRLDSLEENIEDKADKYIRSNEIYRRLCEKVDYYRNDSVYKNTIKPILQDLINLNDIIEATLDIEDLDTDILIKRLKKMQKKLLKSMSNLGLEQVKSENNEKFNSDIHEVIESEEYEDINYSDADEIILESLRTGYIYKKTIFRSELVKTGYSKAE